MKRLFLLSPAHSGGLRAQLLLRPEARFELARQVQIGDATLGDVFAFCSGLYFRGKLTYARRFAQKADHSSPVQVITPSRGLLPAETPIGVAELREFASVSVDAGEPLFAGPLKKAAEQIADDPLAEVVLLGSIATGKYVDCLMPIFRERLLFPADFVGRGDMSRGALMLRSAASGDELSYISVSGAVRRGSRPARLPK